MGRLQGKGRIAAELLKGLLLAVLVTTLVLLLLAFVMLKWEQLAAQAEGCILLTYVLSSLAGGWFCGRRSSRRKFLHGLALGLLYFALLFLISGLGDTAMQPTLVRGALSLALCALGGMLGGMLAG